MSEGITDTGAETTAVDEVYSSVSSDEIDRHARVSCCVLFLRDRDAGGAFRACGEDAIDEVAFGGD